MGKDQHEEKKKKNKYKLLNWSSHNDRDWMEEERKGER